MVHYTVWRQCTRSVISAALGTLTLDSIVNLHGDQAQLKEMVTSSYSFDSSIPRTLSPVRKSSRAENAATIRALRKSIEGGHIEEIQGALIQSKIVVIIPHYREKAK